MSGRQRKAVRRHDRQDRRRLKTLVAGRRRSRRQGAPNILVVLFDDVGFSDFGCYGSAIKTPTIDKLAAEGLRYSRLPHHRDVLDHARGAADRAQPSFGRRRLPRQFR